MKDFFELTDQELAALGIPLEEEGDRTYRDIALGLKASLMRKAIWPRGRSRATGGASMPRWWRPGASAGCDR